MRRTMKRLTALMLAVLMVAAVLAGCGGRGSGSSGGRGDSGQSSARSDKDNSGWGDPQDNAPQNNSQGSSGWSEGSGSKGQEMDTPDLAAYTQERTVTVNVTLENGTSTGSGFFIDDQGTIVTNYHVIDGAQSMTVTLSDGGKYDVSEIVDFQEMYDIAVLRVNVSGHSYLNVAGTEPRTGEEVYAVGASLGFLEGSFSNGMVSATSRMVGNIECIQTTAAISSGNSGGPLVNKYGEVVGINAMTYTSGQNLNLAIKIGTLDKLSMDKRWTLNRYREWYKKEIDRSYNVWNYTLENWELSKINTYQHVTDQSCLMSSTDWKFLEGDFNNCGEGYHDQAGIYIYEYHVSEFDAYTDYLYSIGFSFLESEDFTTGTSYYYMNEFSGHKVDLFVVDGDELLAVEPYCQ